jgi:hypothetical protein
MPTPNNRLEGNNTAPSFPASLQLRFFPFLTLLLDFTASLEAPATMDEASRAEYSDHTPLALESMLQWHEDMLSAQGIERPDRADYRTTPEHFFEFTAPSSCEAPMREPTIAEHEPSHAQPIWDCCTIYDENVPWDERPPVYTKPALEQTEAEQESMSMKCERQQRDGEKDWYMDPKRSVEFKGAWAPETPFYRDGGRERGRMMYSDRTPLTLEGMVREAESFMVEGWGVGAMTKLKVRGLRG